MPLHDQPAFIELLRSTRCADDALLQVAMQPMYELLDLTAQLFFSVMPKQPGPGGKPRAPRPSVPPSL